jgi:hypothetical protein
MRVGPLPADIINQYHDGGVSFPVSVYGAYDDDGRVYAVGGLMWLDGRCFAWVDVFLDISAHALTLCRWGRRMLRMARQMGETEVFIYRDEQHASSAKLVAILGFEFVGVLFTEGLEAGKEIYACRV